MGSPIVIVGIIAVVRNTSRSSLAPVLIFWSGSSKITGYSLPGRRDPPFPIVNLGSLRDKEAVEKPVSTETDSSLYRIKPTFPLGASFFILILAWSLESKFSKTPEFGVFSTKVTILEKVSPLLTDVSGWSLFDFSSITESNSIESSPLFSKPRLEREGNKLTKPGPPLDASFPELSKAW